MTCSRETCITDWKSIQDAKDAWARCGCLVCMDALNDDKERLKETKQTKL